MDVCGVPVYLLELGLILEFRDGSGAGNFYSPCPAPHWGKISIPNGDGDGAKFYPLFRLICRGKHPVSLPISLFLIVEKNQFLSPFITKIVYKFFIYEHKIKVS